MSKLFVILFILLLPSLYAECNKKIDSSKVMLFIDTNDSSQEIQKAEEGACIRGEKLIVIPGNQKEFKELKGKLTEISKKHRACINRQTKDCNLSDLTSQYHKLEEKFFKLREQNIPSLVDDQLSQFKNVKKVVTSLVVSGHDGGGTFSGDKGSIHRHELGDIFKDYLEVNQVTSAFLLGCYTGTKHEVKEWEGLFPELRLLAGYDDSAPLSDRPVGHQFITELFKNEKELLSQRTQKGLENKVFNSINSLMKINSALYIKPLCLENSDYKAFYYGSLKKSKSLQGLSFKECKQPEIIKEIEEMEILMEKYMSGELEPPRDTAKGELRRIYSRLRKLEHCVGEEQIHLKSESVFNLLFFHGVKDSFTSFYKNDLEKADQILKELDKDKYLKNIEAKISDYEKLKNNYIKENEQISSNFEAYVKNKKQEYEDYKARHSKLLADPNYVSLLNKFPHLKNEDQAWPAKGLNSADSAKQKELIALKNEMSRLKYVAFQPNLDAKKAMSINQYQIDSLSNKITNSSNLVLKVKDDFPGVWIPTAANLKNKTRKEIIENTHKTHELLSGDSIPNRQREALYWAKDVTDSHLYAFYENPFSWHELRNRGVEAPRNVQTLKSYQTNFEDD